MKDSYLKRGYYVASCGTMIFATFTVAQAGERQPTSAQAAAIASILASTNAASMDDDDTVEIPLDAPLNDTLQRGPVAGETGQL